jgi:addiction module RelB/DinJ family antitoxin
MALKNKTRTPAKKTKVIQTRLDEDLINQANIIFEEVGLSASDIIRVLFKQVVNSGEIPLSFKTHRPYYSPEQIADIESSLDEIESGKLLLSLKPNEDIGDFFDKNF